MKIAIVGGESLLGREVRDVLQRSPLSPELSLIGADEDETGRLTEVGDEAVVITPMDEVNLTAAGAVILAGSAASARKAWQIAGSLTPVIDLTRTLEDVPSARLRAPLAEPGPQPGGSPAIVAHPASVALAMFFSRLQSAFPIERAVTEIFEPASERGQAGIDELHQQTVKLFSFQALPKDVFDAQIAYNLLPRYGAESPLKLDLLEAGIERHLMSLLALHKRTLLPSLRLVQAPVFHGHSISVWVEFGREANLSEISDVLGGVDVDIREGGDEPATNVSVAGESGITISAIRPDRHHRRAWWFWIVADNLRLCADNAARVVEELAGAET